MELLLLSGISLGAVDSVTTKKHQVFALQNHEFYKSKTNAKDLITATKNIKEQYLL